MKRLCFLSIFISLSVLVSCDLTGKKNVKTAEEFYKVYGEREDLDRLMDFYSENSQLVDAIPQIPTQGKENIKNLYSFSWKDTLYEKHPDYSQSVTIKDILANDSIVVVGGKYNPYFYNGKLQKEVPFNTWLYFDDKGKIFKQVEWTQFSIETLQEIIDFKKSTIDIEL